MFCIQCYPNERKKEAKEKLKKQLMRNQIKKWESETRYRKLSITSKNDTLYQESRMLGTVNSGGVYKVERHTNTHIQHIVSSMINTLSA